MRTPSAPVATGVRAALEGVVAGLVAQVAAAGALRAAGVDGVDDPGSAARTATWGASLAAYVGVAAWRLRRGGAPAGPALAAPVAVAVAPAVLIGGIAAGGAWATSPVARVAPVVVWLVANPLACVAAARRR